MNSEEKAKLVSLYVGSVFFHVENIFIVFFEIKGTFKAFVQWGKKSFKVTHIKNPITDDEDKQNPTSVEDLTCSNMPWLDLAWHNLTWPLAFAILAILTSFFLKVGPFPPFSNAVSQFGWLTICLLSHTHKKWPLCFGKQPRLGPGWLIWSEKSLPP